MPGVREGKEATEGAERCGGRAVFGLGLGESEVPVGPPARMGEGEPCVPQA